MKEVTKILKKETKNQKGGFLGILSASGLDNTLTWKGMLRAGYGSSNIKFFDSTPSFNKLWNT